MAHLTSKAVTLVLVVFMGACAQKNTRFETPEQPDPTTTEQEPLPTKPLIPPPPGAENETLRERLEREKQEEREGRKERYRENDRRALERIVQSDEEADVVERGREIEDEYAEKRMSKVVRKTDSPAERIARREIAKAEKLEREAEEERSRAFRRASPVGCEPPQMELNPGAQEEAFFYVQLVVRIVNQGKQSIVVETPYKGLGPIITGLCPGGSANVSFVLRWEDPQQVQIPIIVRTTLPNGKVVVRQNYYFLSKWSRQWNRVNYQTFLVNLDNGY